MIGEERGLEIMIIGLFYFLNWKICKILIKIFWYVIDVKVIWFILGRGG